MNRIKKIIIEFSLATFTTLTNSINDDYKTTFKNNDYNNYDFYCDLLLNILK